MTNTLYRPAVALSRLGLASPLPYGSWVAAVEYEDPWGNLYRQDLPQPTVGQFNYVECGGPEGRDVLIRVS